LPNQNPLAIKKQIPTFREKVGVTLSCWGSDNVACDHKRYQGQRWKADDGHEQDERKVCGKMIVAMFIQAHNLKNILILSITNKLSFLFCIKNNMFSSLSGKVRSGSRRTIFGVRPNDAYYEEKRQIGVKNVQSFPFTGAEK
jgi:hypothetical protein